MKHEIYAVTYAGGGLLAVTPGSATERTKGQERMGKKSRPRVPYTNSINNSAIMSNKRRTFTSLACGQLSNFDLTKWLHAGRVVKCSWRLPKAMSDIKIIQFSTVLLWLHRLSAYLFMAWSSFISCSIYGV